MAWSLLPSIFFTKRSSDQGRPSNLWKEKWTTTAGLAHFFLRRWFLSLSYVYFLFKRNEKENVGKKRNRRMKEVAGLMFLVMLSWAHLYPFPLQVKEWKDMVGPTHPSMNKNWSAGQENKVKLRKWFPSHTSPIFTWCGKRCDGYAEGNLFLHELVFSWPRPGSATILLKIKRTMIGHSFYLWWPMSHRSLVLFLNKKCGGAGLAWPSDIFG